jgi:hypothetical protein
LNAVEVARERTRNHVGNTDAFQYIDHTSGGSHEEVPAVLVVEQDREHRLRIEPGQTAPHYRARSLDERRKLAVADQS